MCKICLYKNTIKILTKCILHITNTYVFLMLPLERVKLGTQPVVFVASAIQHLQCLR